jgi:hypothetical protein
VTSPRQFRSEAEFLEYAEEASLQFRRRYGLVDEAPWTDELLDRALADHGLTRLAYLSDEPPDKVPADFDPSYLVRDHKWRRERAAHLLAHVVLHGGQRCNACRTW